MHARLCKYDTGDQDGTGRHKNCHEASLLQLKTSVIIRAVTPFSFFCLFCFETTRCDRSTDLALAPALTRPFAFGG